jgi:hypothetical protein
MWVDSRPVSQDVVLPMEYALAEKQLSYIKEFFVDRWSIFVSYLPLSSPQESQLPSAISVGIPPGDSRQQ